MIKATQSIQSAAVSELRSFSGSERPYSCETKQPLGTAPGDEQKVKTRIGAVCETESARLRQLPHQ